jgi:sortase A
MLACKIMKIENTRRLSDRIPLGVESALPGMPSPGAQAPARKRAGLWRKLALAAAALLLILGAWLLSQGASVHAKALLAQSLMGRAWERTLAGEREVKPWPWADTWPVARLTVPGMKVDLFVLAGANGRAIAFGPGHMFGTALPGEEGNSVIGGHRDTHLAFLRDLKPGSELVVERQDGSQRRYRVKSTQVLDEKATWVMKQDGGTRMTLITCYPFDALTAGGPLRYVVFADAIRNR